MTNSELDELKTIPKTKLPFGPHKGETFEQAPLYYLQSLMKWPVLNDPLKTKLKTYLNFDSTKRAIEIMDMHRGLMERDTV